MAVRGGLLVNARAREVSVSAVITRADGTVEHLGTIAYWNRNPLRRWIWSIGQMLKDVL